MGRLIDADKLILNLNDYSLQEAPFLYGEDSDTYDAIQECIKTVEEQPTAYDVDKVVQGFDNLKMKYFLTLANTGNADKDRAYMDIANAIDKVIEFVKGGGVDE